MDRVRLSPGTVLAEKYRLETVLGEGGMGTVYRAEHLALKAPVAVKVIDRKVEEGDLTLARFMREAQSAAALRSPHVVQILDYGTDEGRPFMVMELLEGEPLADRLKRVQRLSPEETHHIMVHVAKAVAKAHEAEIVHRDLKPDNIFLVHNEGDEVAKVLDFGVAKVEATALDGHGHTRTGSLLGTPYYMSPEQAQGNKDVDGRSDLWAMGVIAFECLTGVRPFQSDGLGDLVLQICIRDIPIPSHFAPVPEDFDLWFKKACEREPVDRFQTAKELAEALRSALGLDSTSIPESRWAPHADRPYVSRRPSLEGDATVDESETAPRVAPSNVFRAAETNATSAQLSQDRTLIDPPGARGPGEDWQVVPHGARAEDPEARSTRYTSDPLNDTHESSTGSGVLGVALAAIVFGAVVVFGLRELGLLSFGADSASSEKPLKVIGAAPAPSKKKPSSEAAPRSSSDGSRSKNPTGTSSKNDTARGAADSAASSPSESQASGGKTPEEAPSETDRLDALEKELEKALQDSDSSTDGAGSKDAPAQRETGPQPILPEELLAPPPPPPPETSSSHSDN